MKLGNSIKNVLKSGEKRKITLISKSPQNKCPGLKEHVECHSSFYHTGLKKTTEIEHIPIFIQFVPKTNTNEPINQENKKNY